MDWKEACKISDIGKAYRIDFTHKYIRSEKGESIFINMTTKAIRDALFWEIEGYLDWKPL